MFSRCDNPSIPPSPSTPGRICLLFISKRDLADGNKRKQKQRHAKETWRRSGSLRLHCIQVPVQCTVQYVLRERKCEAIGQKRYSLGFGSLLPHWQNKQNAKDLLCQSSEALSCNTLRKVEKEGGEEWN